MNDSFLREARLAAQLRDARHDALVLAMGLYGQNESTMAAEVARVLQKYTPAVEVELGLREPEIEPTDEQMEACRRAA